MSRVVVVVVAFGSEKRSLAERVRAEQTPRGWRRERRSKSRRPSPLARRGAGFRRNLRRPRHPFTRRRFSFRRPSLAGAPFAVRTLEPSEARRVINPSIFDVTQYTATSSSPYATPVTNGPINNERYVANHEHRRLTRRQHKRQSALFTRRTMKSVQSAAGRSGIDRFQSTIH